MILLILLLAGIPVIKNVFALHPSAGFTTEKKTGSLRIMQWNCNGLQGNLPFSAKLIAERFKAVAFINTYKPDIICMQDFANIIAPHSKDNIALLRDTLGYKYFVYTQHYKTIGKNFLEGIGVSIFSKYPITDSGKVFYPFKKKPESIIWVNIATPLGNIKFVTTHLQSMFLSRSTKTKLETDLAEDSAIIMQDNTLEKLKYFQPFHVKEAAFLRGFLDTCYRPLIFTADLNSVPSSFVYKKVKGKDLKDAFLETSYGPGKTYHSLQPALRIDYIFHSQDIHPLQSKVFKTTFSDHDPLLMDFIMNNNH